MKKAVKFVKDLFFSERLSDTLVYIYTVAVVLYQLLYQIIPVRQVIYFLGLDIVSSLLAVAGLGLFLWDLLARRVFLKRKIAWALIALIGIMGVSALARFNYGLVNNAKAIIWQVAQMLVIFPLFERLTKSKLLDMLKLIFFTFSVFAVPCVFVSLYQYYTRMHYIISVGDSTLNQGFSTGRLFGVFGSMHFTTLIFITLAMLAVYFGIKASKKWLRVLYFAVAVLYFVYSTATGTRSIIIGVLCAVLLVGYFVAKRLLKNVCADKKALNVTLRCVASVVAVAVVFLCFMGTTKLLTVSNSLVYNAIQSECPSTPGGDNKPGHSTELERDDVDLSNVSNNRFTIWGEYFDIVLDKPLSTVLGLSPGEYQNVIRQEYSDKFIVQYIKESHPSMYERGYIYDTHSAYVGALIMTGVAGVIALFVFLIIGFVKLLKALYKKQSAVLLTLFGVLVFILVTSFFDSDLFFRCSSTSVLFWMIAGFALKFCYEDKEKDVK